MPDLPAPFPLAILIADAVHIDPGTGKAFILGTFSNIGAHEFPVTHPFFAVYITLTEGRGQVPIRVVIVRTDEDDEPIANIDASLEFSDPRAIVELTVGIQRVVFPKPGEYRVQLFAAGQFLIERRILAYQIPRPSDQP